MKPSEPSEVTRLLLAWRAGNDDAHRRLFDVVYRELHAMARRYMLRERLGHPLQATALVNEAYLKLVDTPQVEWQNRGHFFAVAAQAMRRILIDVARKRRRLKNQGAEGHITLDEELVGGDDPNLRILAIDDALNRLALHDKRKARVVELRFFAGLTVEETAAVLGTSKETVHRDWRMARAWLLAELDGGAL